MTEARTLEQKLKDEIIRTGYPTEVLTANALSERGWYCQLSAPYLDTKESISREFDVRAFRRYQLRDDSAPRYFGVYLAIECKKSDKPWIFFTTPADNNPERNPRLGDYLQSPQSLSDRLFRGNWKGETPIIQNDEWGSFHHYFNHPRWGHNSYEALKGQEKSEKGVQIYSAINTVMKVTQYYTRTLLQTPQFQPVVYPVIVFSGDLFEANVISAEEVEVNPCNHIVYRHNFIPNPSQRADEDPYGKSMLIDVVRSSFVPEYSSIIDTEHQTLHTLINIAVESGKLSFNAV